MKKRNVFLMSMILSLAVASVQAQMLTLPDTIIKDSDNQCGVHYWGQAETTGWIAQITGSCPNGLLSGGGKASIYDAAGRPLWELSGYFIQGYWIGEAPVPYTLKSVTPVYDGIIISFDLDHNEAFQTRYTGRIKQFEIPVASPLPVEQSVRIIAQTDQIQLFDEEEPRKKLTLEAIHHAKKLSPQVKRIYFLGSKSENPQPDDVSFFAEINLENNQVRVKRRPSTFKKNADETPADDIPRPKEIRQEAGVPVMRVLPVVPENSEEKSSDIDAVTKPLSPVPNQAPDESQKENETISDSIPTSDNLDKIPNLLTSSRLLKQPVEGQALVHISQFDGAGTVLIDQPVLLKARGANLSLGWGIAKGQFSYTSQKGEANNTLGFIDIKAFYPLTEDDITE